MPGIGESITKWSWAFDNVLKSNTENFASNFNTGTKARISLPLFFNPHAATIIECVPSCQGPGNPAKYEPVEAGPYVQALIQQSNRIGRPGVMQRMAEERLKLG